MTGLARQLREVLIIKGSEALLCKTYSRAFAFSARNGGCLKQAAQGDVARREAVEHIDNQIEVVAPVFPSRRGDRRMRQRRVAEQLLQPMSGCTGAEFLLT